MGLETESEPESPCIYECRLTEDLCTGCFRTLEEIKHWGAYEPHERKKILLEVQDRKPK